MRRQKKFFFFIWILAFSLGGIVTSHASVASKLAGRWKVTKVVSGKNKIFRMPTGFKIIIYFKKSNHTYSIKMKIGGSLKKNTTGTWKVEKDFLYTVEGKKKEKMQIVFFKNKVRLYKKGKVLHLQRLL